jgi:hypothetical protein
MLRKILFLILMASTILLIPVFGMAQTASQGPVAALLEGTYEFQPVVEGSTVTHEFILKNRGDKELSILDIKSG